MAHIKAITQALTARFAADAITPPTGYNDPGTAVFALPTAITTTPTAIVFPPEGEFRYAAHMRTGTLAYTVRWYIADTADLPRATTAMYDWSNILLDQLETAFDLDLTPFYDEAFAEAGYQVTSPVTHAVVDGIRFGKLEYAEQEYTGIELSVVVSVVEAFNPST